MEGSNRQIGGVGDTNPLDLDQAKLYSPDFANPYAADNHDISPYCSNKGPSNVETVQDFDALGIGASDAYITDY